MFITGPENEAHKLLVHSRDSRGHRTEMLRTCRRGQVKAECQGN